MQDDSDLQHFEMSLFQTLVFHMPLIVFLLDQDGKFLLSEGDGLKWLGLKPKEAVGKSVWEMYQDVPVIMEKLQEVYQGSPVNYSVSIGDFHMETYINPVFTKDHQVAGAVGATLNVTERVNSEQELEQSWETLNALIKSIPGILYMYNDQGELVFWNTNHETLTGYSAEELQNFHLENWYPDDPESLAAVQKGLADTQVNGFGEADATLHCKDGHKIPMYFTACSLFMNDKQYFVGIGMDMTTLRKTEHDLLELNKTLEDRVKERTQQLHAANEEYYAMNQELMATNEQLVEMQDFLVESEKMAALGSLVAGVAHEVNTPLGVGMTASSYVVDLVHEMEEKMEQETLSPEEIKIYINDLKKASSIIFKNLTRAGSLVQSFKQLSLDQTTEPKRTFDVGAYIEEVLISLSPSIKKTHIKIIHECPDTILMTGYPGALAQIITNLVVNALKYAFPPDTEGHVRIATSKKNGMVTIIFEDDGLGMEKHVLSHIFEPFFTTSRGSGGSGLGLSIVYNIVTRQFEGSIHCESSPGNGTRFGIKLKEEV